MILDGELRNRIQIWMDEHRGVSQRILIYGKAPSNEDSDYSVVEEQSGVAYHWIAQGEAITWTLRSGSRTLRIRQEPGELLIFPPMTAASYELASPPSAVIYPV